MSYSHQAHSLLAKGGVVDLRQELQNNKQNIQHLQSHFTRIFL